MKAPLLEAQLDPLPIAILGVPFDPVTAAETTDFIDKTIASGHPHYGLLANVGQLVQAREDVELRRIFFDAHLVLADSQAIIRSSQRLGQSLPERIVGPVLIPQLLALAEQKGWKVFFLGGTDPSLAAAAAKQTRAQYPKIQFVGTYAPPDKPLLEMDHADILRRIREVQPDLLLVTFREGKQEKWISMNYRETGVPFTLGLGETNYFLAGGRAADGRGLDWLKFKVAVWRQWWQLRAPQSPRSTSAKSEVVPDPFGNFIIRAPARLTLTEARAFHGEWQRATENGHVLFDLGNTGVIDSTGLGLLMRLRKRARELGHQFFLVALRPTVETALKAMRLDEFFTLQASVAGARIIMESFARTAAVSSGVKESTLQIRWTGEVTALNAVELGAKTEAELSQTSAGMSVVIDLARVTFVDSTGTGLMLRFKKNLARRDIHLKFQNPVESVRNVLRHTKLEEYLLGKTE